MRVNFVWLIAIILFSLSGCKTKGDLKREQELDRLRQEVKEVKGDRADVDTLSEELKVELARMNNIIEERSVQQSRALDEIRKDLASIAARLQTVERQAQQDDNSEREKNKAVVAEKPKPTLELGRKYLDDGRYDEAVDIFRTLSKSRAKGDEPKKAQFLLGETFFAAKDYASAALEFSEFKKLYPKDNQVPLAIYRQANCFKLMGKNKEAKLFYHELLDRFPKSPLVAKAKKESRGIK